MTTSDPAVRLLQVLLVVLFAGLTVGQVSAVPGLLESVVAGFPELADLRWPLVVVALLLGLSVQVVIVCTWKLLGLVASDRIFTDASSGWVDTIVAAMAAAWVLLLAVSIYLTVTSPDPKLLMLLAGMVLAGGAGVLLMVVMRALLRQASTLRADMEAVI